MTHRLDAQQARWEREMRRLSVLARVFGTVLLALIVRIFVSGANPANLITIGACAVLLLTALVLLRYGRNREPGRGANNAATAAGDSKP